MVLRNLLLILCVCVTASCTSKKTATDAVTNGEEKSQTMMTDAKMMEAGFQQGTIVASKAEGDCPFVIEMAGDAPYFLDPIDIDESYKKDGMKIWFKFRGLRMMNRCDKATPISIEEVEVRK